MTEYYVIQSTGPDYDAVKLGIAWLVEQDEPAAAIAVYSTNQIEVIANILGSTRIVKDRRFTANGTTVDLLIKKDWSGFARIEKPILAVWLDDKYLEKVDTLGATHILSIPFTPDANAKWRAAHGPKDLLTGDTEERKSISDPVVEVAVSGISMNTGTGIHHPMDRDRAVLTFRALRKAGIEFDAAEVRAWAVGDGWKSEHASDLAEVAQKINDGRALRTRSGDRGIPRDAVARWKSIAEERGEA